MEKKDALKIVLTEVCCDNGQEFCTICPMNKEDCENIHFKQEELLLAVKTLLAD